MVVCTSKRDLGKKVAFFFRGRSKGKGIVVAKKGAGVAEQAAHGSGGIEDFLCPFMGV